MNNISYSVVEVCDSSNNEVIDIKELSNNIMISNNRYKGLIIVIFSLLALFFSQYVVALILLLIGLKFLLN